MAAADLCASPPLARILEAAPERRGRCAITARAEAWDSLTVPEGTELEILPPETSAAGLAERFLSGEEPEARWRFAAAAEGALDARGAAGDRRLCVGRRRRQRVR